MARPALSGRERSDESIDSFDPVGSGGLSPDQHQPYAATRVLRRYQEGNP